MPRIEDVVGSYTPLTRSGSEWQGVCPIESHAEPLAVIGDTFRCYGCGASGNAMDFLKAIGDPDPEHTLSNGKVWEPTLTKPTPPPSKYAIARIEWRDGTVLITDSRKAAEVAAKLLPRYVVAAWPDGGSRWDGLEPLRGRTVLLWPTPEGAEAMLRLEAVLADPAGLACKGKIVEPLDLAAWTGTSDELIAWAKAHVRPLNEPKNPVVRVAESGIATPSAGNVAAEAPPSTLPPPPIGPNTGDLSGSEPPPVQDTDFPAEAGKSKPRKRQRHLAVVGNTALAPDADPDPLPAELSEDALSDDFASQHGEDWRCVKAWGQWLHWDGEAWAEDRDDSRVEPMRAICRGALYTPEGQRLTPDGRRKLGRQAVAYAALRYAGTDPRIRSTPEAWDSDPYMLGVPGGVIDLKAGKLIEAAREQHITMRCAVAPADGEPTHWLRMLRYWLGEDDDVIGFLRRYLGYALTGDGREQCMAFFYGPAAAGKGTIMRLISYILGSVPPPDTSKFRSYHYEAPIATFLESRNDRHTTELAAMHQKRLITSEEPAAGAKWDEAKIKWLTGGSFVTARYMRGDNFSFSMTGKIIVAANHRPRLATTDASIKRRMHVIPFEHPVPDEERDNALDARLRAEAPQILNWLIQACMEWQDCGLGLPEKISSATETYLQAEDVLAQWMDEACERDGDSDSKSLYQSYCRWAEEQGEKIWSRRAWANALVERGFKTRKGTAGMRMICGLVPRLAPPPGA